MGPNITTGSIREDFLFLTPANWNPPFDSDDTNSSMFASMQRDDLTLSPLDGIIFNGIENNFAAKSQGDTNDRDAWFTFNQPEGQTAGSATPGNTQASSRYNHLYSQQTLAANPFDGSASYNAGYNKNHSAQTMASYATSQNSQLFSQTGSAATTSNGYRLIPPQRVSVASQELMVNITKPLSQKSDSAEAGPSGTGKTRTETFMPVPIHPHQIGFSSPSPFGFNLKLPGPFGAYRSAPATPMPSQHPGTASTSISIASGLGVPAGQLFGFPAEPIAMQRGLSHNSQFASTQQQTGLGQRAYLASTSAAVPEQPGKGKMRARRDAYVLSADKDNKPPAPWDPNPQGRNQQNYGQGAGYNNNNSESKTKYYTDPASGQRFDEEMTTPVKSENRSFFDDVQGHKNRSRRIALPSVGRVDKTRFVSNQTAEDYRQGGGHPTSAHKARVANDRKRKREEGEEGEIAEPRYRRRKKVTEHDEDNESDQEADEETPDGDVFIKCEWPRSDGKTCQKMLWVLGPGTIQKSSAIRAHLLKCKYHDDIVYGISNVVCRFGTACINNGTMCLDNIDRHVTKTGCHTRTFTPWVKTEYTDNGAPVFRLMTPQEKQEWDQKVQTEKAKQQARRQREKTLKA